MFRLYLCVFLNLYRVPLWLFKLTYMQNHPEKYTPMQRHARLRGLVRLIKMTLMIRTKSFGVENLPKDGGYILFPNHQGKYDALGITYVHPRPCAVVMDEAKSHTPVLSQVINISGGKRMKLNDVRQALTIIKEMTEETKDGKIFIIFPEGGYHKNHNRVMQFKPGSFKSAMVAKVPIVPVALLDSYKAFEGIRIGLVNTEVHFLPPIMPEEYAGMKTTEVAEEVRRRIIEKITERETALGRKISNLPGDAGISDRKEDKKSAMQKG